MSTERTSSIDAPLRIAFYSPDLPDSGTANGIVTYTRIMRDSLRALNHLVTIVTPEHIEQADGRVLPLPSSNRAVRRARHFIQTFVNDGSDPWVRLSVFEAFRAAHREGAEVFEIEESFGWAGRLMGHGVPIIERLHGPHVFVRDKAESAGRRLLGDQREKAELESFKRVAAVTAPTERLLDALTARYGVILPVTRAIPNPIPIAPQESLWRPECADPNQLLFVGRFDLCKGADVVIRAFARASRERPALRLIIAGPDSGLAGPDGNLIHLDEFIARELDPEARCRIRYLGSQAPERVAELRRQSAAALIGSRFENFPYSIAEAMAVGMPILTTDTFGGGEMIRDALDGLIVPIADVELMAAGILEITKDSSRAAGMGRSAQARATAWLSPQRVGDEAVALYREAIARNRSNWG